MNTSYDAYEEFRDDPAVEAAVSCCQQLDEEASDEGDWWHRAVHLFAHSDDDETLQVVLANRIIEEAPMALVTAVLDDDLEGAQLALMFLQHTDVKMDQGKTHITPLVLAINQRCSLAMIALLIDHSSDSVGQAGSSGWWAVLGHERDPWRHGVEQLLQAAATPASGL